MSQFPRRRCMALLAGGVALSVLGACAGLRFRKPDVAVAGIRLLDANLLEQRFVLTLRITNPNPTEIPIEGLTFNLSLNDQPFAQGVSNQAVVIPRLGEGRLEVTASTGLATFLRQFKAFGKGREQVAYRFQGRLVTGTFGGLDFDQKGELALPKGLGGTGSGTARPATETF